jgi:hypothetical protein
MALSDLLQGYSNKSDAVAIDSPGGKHNLKMKIKAQQMNFRQDITKI